MTHLKENFVVDAKGNRVGVFLPIKDYNKLMESWRNWMISKPMTRP